MKKKYENDASAYNSELTNKLINIFLFPFQIRFANCFNTVPFMNSMYCDCLFERKILYNHFIIIVLMHHAFRFIQPINWNKSDSHSSTMSKKKSKQRNYYVSFLVTGS